MNGMKASWFGLSGVVFFVAATILGGMQWPGYSHTSQLISESYAIGTPYGIYLRYLGFLPAGLFIAAFAWLAIKALPKSTLTKMGFSGVGIFYGLATVLVSLFPCDKGCDKELVDPGISQVIHNLTGLLTYLVVPVSLIVVGIAARKWINGKNISWLGVAGGMIAMIFVGILSADLHSPLAGLYQRIIEGSILAWLLICSLYLFKLQKN
jgi:Protein of unknown function (DUF998)